jgi:DNA-binding MarR family transcriptional regulator
MKSQKPKLQNLSPTDAERLRAWLSVVETYQLCSDALERELTPLHLSLPQFEVLLSLFRRGAQTQQQLVAQSYVVKSHLSGIVKHMLRRGWVSRKTDGQDKRSKLVTLTKSGKALGASAQAIQKRTIDLMFAPLSKRKIRDTQLVMEVVTETLKNHLIQAGP